MAKDDYFVIVYKILSYLYVKLKSGGRCKSKHDYSRQSTTADQLEILGLYHEKFN